MLFILCDPKFVKVIALSVNILALRGSDANSTHLGAFIQIGGFTFACATLENYGEYKNKRNLCQHRIFTLRAKRTFENTLLINHCWFPLFCFTLRKLFSPSNCNFQILSGEDTSLAVVALVLQFKWQLSTVQANARVKEDKICHNPKSTAFTLSDMNVNEKGEYVGG